MLGTAGVFVVLACSASLRANAAIAVALLSVVLFLPALAGVYGASRPSGRPDQCRIVGGAMNLGGT